MFKDKLDTCRITNKFSFFLNLFFNNLGFLIVSLSWVGGNVPRLPSFGIHISQKVRLARCCASGSYCHCKNHQII